MEKQRQKFEMGFKQQQIVGKVESGLLSVSAASRKYLRDHRGEFGSVAQGIEIMNLASSSYHYKPKSDVDGQASSDTELRDHIERIQGECAGYGYRRPGKQLRREGICLSRSSTGSLLAQGDWLGNLPAH